jgi:hypothetical protein
MAVIDYAKARRYIDEARHAELRQAIPQTPHVDVPELVGDLPVPRWDRVPPTTPVDRLDRVFAVALLDVACQAEVLSPANRKRRIVFAANARTAADLLALFLDTDPNLRHRSEDPELAPSLARLAFVSEVLQVRSRGSLSRAEFKRFLERTASGESLDTLRAELGIPNEKGSFNWLDESPAVGWYDRSSEPTTTPEDWFSKPATEPAATEPAPAEPVVAAPPATDLDRARIAKYLERALVDERLDPGELAARTLALWSATTRDELAALIVDLPVPVNEPLRDRKFDHRADDLIAPADRQAAVDRLDRAMADHKLSLWEYETRLDVALKARNYGELWPATAGLNF